MKAENMARLDTARNLIADAASRMPQDSAYDLLKHAAVQLEQIADSEGDEPAKVPTPAAATKSTAKKK